MFDTIYTDKNAEGSYGIVPILNESLWLANLQHPSIKCRGVHDIPLLYPSSNKVVTIGEFILEVVVYPNKLFIEIAHRFLSIDTASYISFSAIDSARNAAVITYETRNSDEEGTWLNWAYIMLESNNFYKFKSRAPEGSVISSLTPNGLIILTDHRVYKFERDTQGMRLEVLKYNGPELSALMFYGDDTGLAVTLAENHTFLYKVGSDLVQIGPSYECCNNGNYNIERTSDYTSVISSLNTDNQLLTIYPNMEDFNEQRVVTSILPSTHNVSVDVYKGYVSIVECGGNYTRKTTIDDAGVKRIEEPKFLPERHVWAQGAYRRAPGPSYMYPKIYEEAEHLSIAEGYLDRGYEKVLDTFLGGRVAHYIAPSIAPQWYFTKTANGKITAAPTLPSPTLSAIECTLKQHTEVLALALLIGSPVYLPNIKCYNDETTGETVARYAFGQYLGHHVQGIESTTLRHVREHIGATGSWEERWAFPEVGSCTSGTHCEEGHQISTLRKLFPNATEILENVLRPAACTYSDVEWRDKSSETAWSLETSLGTSLAVRVYDNLVRTLGAVSKSLGELSSGTDEL